MGSGMVLFERVLMSFYRPSIVTFPLSFVRIHSMNVRTKFKARSFSEILPLKVLG